MLIFWDVDDVLNRLMACWLKKHVPDQDYSAISENPPHEIIGWKREDYLSSLDAFRNSDAGQAVEVNESVLSWFQKYGKDHRHIAVTARPLETMPNQSWWVYTYFGEWIHSVVAVTVGRGLAHARQYQTKAEYIRQFSEEAIFIDDAEKNIQDVSSIGVESFLFPQPWNHNSESVDMFLGKITKRVSK